MGAPATSAAVTSPKPRPWVSARHLLVGLLVVFLISGPWILAPFTLTLMNYVGLYSLVALGLALMTGIGGMTSFGQAAFVGLGAYASAVVSVTFMASPWLGLLAGIGLTASVAFVLGSVTLKLSGHFLPLGTIAWGLAIYFLFGNLDLLGGHTGLSGVPPIEIFGLSFADGKMIYGLIWAMLLLAILLLSNLLNSREGRAFRSLKGGLVMAEAMGVNTSAYRMKAFLISAILAGISGWLYVHMQRFVNPTPFSLNIGIEYLFMAVLGGAGYLWGALLGAVVITVMKQMLQDTLPKILGVSGSFEIIVFGILMLIVLQRFPGGLWPALRGISSRFLPSLLPPPAQVTAKAMNDGRSHPKIGETLIDASAVTKRFGGLVANDAVSLDLKAGEIHALIGPNGAGKSTFFNMISGVDEPTEGKISIMGQSLHQRPSREFARLGLGRTFQHVRLLPNMSVLENVSLGAHLRGHKGTFSAMLRLNKAEEDALLSESRRQIERVGLGDHVHDLAGALPLGKQRIVEIARALAGDPHILLLDEPAAGLRHLEKQELARLLRDLRSEGIGVLLVEHDIDFVMRLADRVTVLDFGKVISHGAAEQVQADPKVIEAYLGSDDD